VQFVIEELAAAGSSHVLLVTNPRQQAIEDYFAADPPYGVEIHYAQQLEPRGPADALLYAEAFAEGHAVVVAHGDALIETPPPTQAIVSRLVAAFERTGADVVLAVREVPDDEVARSGIVVADDEDEFIVVQSAIEKPDPHAIPTRTAMMGRYVIGPGAFAALRTGSPRRSGELQLADAVQHVLDRGGQVVAVRLGEGERRHDIGSLEGYCATFIHYALKHPQLGQGLRTTT
jgi:UTP--glucose-1-phosphate uridylyltransferase